MELTNPKHFRRFVNRSTEFTPKPLGAVQGIFHLLNVAIFTYLPNAGWREA
ncbi:hypothetical protein QUF80_14980 [Desulfococcaceae bacterium HSG8]|nr:hypothetical protein [Desulfococcaceae bacterium HSG8]